MSRSQITETKMNIKKLVVKSLEEVEIPDVMKPSYEIAELIWNLTIENLQATADTIQESMKKNKYITKDFVSHAISNISLIQIQSSSLYRSFAKIFHIKIPEFFIDNEVTTIISEDNITEFQNHFNRQHQSRVQNFINKYFPDSIAYGAINIFKFLLLNRAEIKAEYCKHAIIGGNLEIIKIICQKGFSFHDYFSVAIKFHRNDIADFILENYGAYFMNVADCLRFYNYKAAIFMYANKCPIDYQSNPFNCVLATSILLDDYYTTNYFVENKANLNELLITAQPSNLVSLNLFLVALLKNNTEIIKLLLTNGAVITKKIMLAQQEIETALTIAVRNQNIEIVNLLLSNGVIADCKVLNNNEMLWRNEFFSDFFEQSIDFGEERSILNARLFKRNFSEIHRMIPSYLSESDSYYEDLDSEYVQMAYSSDMEEYEEEDYAFEEEEDLSDQMLEKIINKRLSIFNYSKINPLIIAIALENAEIIKLLIEYGADVNGSLTMDSDKITPLIFAIQTCTKAKYNVVAQLLSCGANPNLLCGKTPIQESLINKNDKSIAMLLLDHDANANYFNPFKDSPLILAMKHKFEDLVLAMLKKGTNPNYFTKDYDTPLEFAKSHKLKVSYDALLQFGANPNVREAYVK